MTHTNEPLKDIVTVAEMARMIGLSRSRFYALLVEGIMPAPCRNESTGRPFYKRDQQEQCLLVRRTNCGINGKPILFYAITPRPPVVRKSKPKSLSPKGASPSSTATDPLMQDLQRGLAQLGMTDVPEAKIRRTLSECYPDGHGQIDSAAILMSVFRHLRRQNTNDNDTR